MSETFDAARLVASAQEGARQLVLSGKWTGAMQSELDVSFQHAALAAQRASTLYERSVYLRQIARRVIPRRLFPLLRDSVQVVAHARQWAGSRARGPRS